MERAVNTAWSVGSSKAEWLLSAQLHYLSAYLDIYLETLDPNTFTQNMVFFKSNR